uniref:Uncharacterized protein n=1 Tax=Aegilops tauschii subsp. strangulata TaxID=200361 RepID=A0A453GV00_AEGTS
TQCVFSLLPLNSKNKTKNLSSSSITAVRPPSCSATIPGPASPPPPLPNPIQPSLYSSPDAAVPWFLLLPLKSLHSISTMAPDNAPCTAARRPWRNLLSSPPPSPISFLWIRQLKD